MFPRMLLLAVALVAVAANRPQPVPIIKVANKEVEEIADLSGYYVCKGVELGGKIYNGICVVSKKNDVYLVQWVVGAGAPFVGIGIRQGNTFAAGWSLPGDKGVLRGVNLYRIEPGPRLVGRWATLPGNGHLQSETLTFLKPLEEEEEGGD